MDVSENSGTPKSSILIGISIINHPFGGTPIFGNIHMYMSTIKYLNMYWKPSFLGAMLVSGSVYQIPLVSENK